MNLFLVCKALQKFQIPARYIDRNTFAIEDKEINVRDSLVSTDTARWRYNSDKSFFYGLKDEKLFYLDKEQMLKAIGLYNYLNLQKMRSHDKH